MYLKAYHHRSPQLSWRYAVTNWLFFTCRCCDSMQATRGNQYDLCMTLLTLFEQNGWKQRQALTSTIYKSRLMKTNVFFMSWNPPRRSQSLQSTMPTCIYCNLPSNMAKGWNIQYLQLYIHSSSYAMIHHNPTSSVIAPARSYINYPICSWTNTSLLWPTDQIFTAADMVIYLGRF